MILTLIFSLQIVLCRVEETQLDLVYPLDRNVLKRLSLI